MLKMFKISFKLRKAYKSNGIIFGLKSLPLIRKLLPGTLYASQDLKTFVNIISILAEVATVFLGKFLYLALIYWLITLLNASATASFVHVILFLTIIGGILNTHIFNPTKDKFYAISLMRMDARKYAVSNYIYYLLKTFIGFLVGSVIFGLLNGNDIITCIAVTIFVVSIKASYTAWVLAKCKRDQETKNENKPTPLLWVTVAILMLAAFLPPYLGYAISEINFIIMAGLMIIPGILSIRYIVNFDEYRRIYKELLTPENFAMVSTSKKAVAETQRLAMQKKISIDSSQTSNKAGYQFLNELFMKRHSKLLTKSAKRITLICILIYIIIVSICIIFPEINEGLNGLLHTSLPYFLFIMYMINRGSVITQAMFMNCDHSMLTYRFYRQPKAILSLFMERLKFIIIINLMPAIVIALALPSLLLITGGTDQPMNYILLCISILAMSVFFSVHHIVLYYLLQPYNINLESKSYAYGIANFVTYLICYYAIGKQIPTLIFGTAITLFCVIYAFVASGLAYLLAPKTFKMK